MLQYPVFEAALTGKFNKFGDNVLELTVKQAVRYSRTL